MAQPGSNSQGNLPVTKTGRSEEHTSELQSQSNLVCRLLLEKKNEKNYECWLLSLWCFHVCFFFLYCRFLSFSFFLFVICIFWRLVFFIFFLFLLICVFCALT